MFAKLSGHLISAILRDFNMRRLNVCATAAKFVQNALQLLTVTIEFSVWVAVASLCLCGI